jgi:hypothetical protein
MASILQMQIPKRSMTTLEALHEKIFHRWTIDKIIAYSIEHQSTERVWLLCHWRHHCAGK